MNRIEQFFDFLDKRHTFHRATLIVTMWMSYRSFIWAAEYAEHTVRAGLEVAAILGAVLAPIAYVQKSVFDTYSTSRKGI